MKGVLVVSHGRLAEGMIDSARFIFGNGIRQLEACCYLADSTPESFSSDFERKYRLVDDDDGVIILADIPTGAVFRKTVQYLTDNNEIIVGANLDLLLEILTRRIGLEKIDINETVNNARKAVYNLRGNYTVLSEMVE